jgi:prepilin-type N-terminal cleavage/methylation domain-containing protein
MTFVNSLPFSLSTPSVINPLCDRPQRTISVTPPKATAVYCKRPNSMAHAFQKTRDGKGFTLVEVLIGILIIAAFSATAMQALVASTAMKIKSQELSESTNWMQEDLESVKFEANRLDFDPIAKQYNPNLDACKPSAGYAQRLMGVLPPVMSPKTSTIGNRSYEFTRDATLSPSAPNILQLSYKIQRVSGGSTTGKPYTLHAEVIPDAAFACPS